MEKDTKKASLMERTKEEKKVNILQTKSGEKVQKVTIVVLCKSKEVASPVKYKSEISVIEGFAQIGATAILQFLRDERKMNILNVVLKIGKEILCVPGFPYDPSIIK